MSEITLLLGDCLDVMRGMDDASVDAVITDPPYGIGAAKMNLGFSQSSRFEKSDWDDKTPSAEVFSEILRIGKTVIIWGGNYFDLPPTRCFLIWDKGNSFYNRSFSECEMAWTNLDKSARIFKHDPLGNGDYRNRLHKTQKPLALIEWVVSNYTKEGDTVFDPFAGSGTTLIAAAKLGRNAIGCEINPTYFEIAQRHIQEAQAQLTLAI